jgi:hypothetical protein
MSGTIKIRPISTQYEVITIEETKTK